MSCLAYPVGSVGTSRGFKPESDVIGFELEEVKTRSRELCYAVAVIEAKTGRELA